MLTAYQLEQEQRNCSFFKNTLNAHIARRKATYQNNGFQTRDGESIGSMTVEELVSQFNAEFAQYTLSVACEDNIKHEILSGGDVNHLLSTLFKPSNSYTPSTIRALTNYIDIMESIAKITTKVFKHAPTDYSRLSPFDIDFFLSKMRLHVREFNLPTQKGRSIAKKQLKLLDDDHRFRYLPKTLCMLMEHALLDIMAKEAIIAYDRNQRLKNAPDITL
jgi:hypothetical protein